MHGAPGYVTPTAIADPEDYIATQPPSLRRRLGSIDEELHAANGYLPHQFIDPTSNRRDDQWGGSPESRCRFTLRCIDEMIAVWGSDRVGIKLTPNGGYNDMGFDKAGSQETYGYLLSQLNQRQVAFLELCRWTAAFDPINRATKDWDVVKELGPLFAGVLFLNGEYDAQTGADAVAQGDGHAISFGRPYLANPDLPTRYRLDLPLNIPDLPTFYVHPEAPLERYSIIPSP